MEGLARVPRADGAGRAEDDDAPHPGRARGLQRRHRSQHVDAEDVARALALPVRRRRRDRRRVDDDVDGVRLDGAPQRGHVPDVADHPADALARVEAGGVVGRAVVEADHVMATSGERAHHVDRHEPGGPGHEHAGRHERLPGARAVRKQRGRRRRRSR
jgi:hypothetical protein